MRKAKQSFREIIRIMSKDCNNASAHQSNGAITQSFGDLLGSELVDYDDRGGGGDLELFEHQVSGHGVAEKGLLKNKQGHILKPLQPPPKGEREVRFYRNVHKTGGGSGDSCYSELREFVPLYYGVACVRRAKTTPSYYLVIEDMLQGLAKPCVMDVKIGRQTWSPDASDEKIRQESSKYVGTRPALGVCVTGMQYWEVFNGGLRKATLSREEGKGLDVLGFQRAMGAYFNVGGTSTHLVRSGRVVAEVMRRLERIEDVFSRQSSGFRLYGSSVLVAYDAEGLVKDEDDDDGLPGIRVGMIDFAHFHDEEGVVGGGGLDENYLFGVRSLLRVLGGVFGSCGG